MKKRSHTQKKLITTYSCSYDRGFLCEGQRCLNLLSWSEWPMSEKSLKNTALNTAISSMKYHVSNILIILIMRKTNRPSSSVTFSRDKSHLASSVLILNTQMMDDTFNIQTKPISICGCNFLSLSVAAEKNTLHFRPNLKGELLDDGPVQ